MEENVLEDLASQGQIFIIILWLELVTKESPGRIRNPLSSVVRGKVISVLHSLISHKNRLTGSLNDLERPQPFVSDT